MREPEAHLRAAFVSPVETLVNLFADPTTKKEMWVFCGRNVMLLPWLTTTRPGPPLAATLGLVVPNQIMRQTTSPKSAHRTITFNLWLISLIDTAHAETCIAG